MKQATHADNMYIVIQQERETNRSSNSDVDKMVAKVPVLKMGECREKDCYTWPKENPIKFSIRCVNKITGREEEVTDSYFKVGGVENHPRRIDPRLNQSYPSGYEMYIPYVEPKESKKVLKQEVNQLAKEQSMSGPTGRETMVYKDGIPTDKIVGNIMGKKTSGGSGGSGNGGYCGSNSVGTPVSSCGGGPGGGGCGGTYGGPGSSTSGGYYNMNNTSSLAKERTRSCSPGPGICGGHGHLTRSKTGHNLLESPPPGSMNAIDGWTSSGHRFVARCPPKGANNQTEDKGPERKTYSSWRRFVLDTASSKNCTFPNMEQIWQSNLLLQFATPEVAECNCGYSSNTKHDCCPLPPIWKLPLVTDGNCQLSRGKSVFD